MKNTHLLQEITPIFCAVDILFLVISYVLLLLCDGFQRHSTYIAYQLGQFYLELEEMW